jgi:hypothetical protein
MTIVWGSYEPLNYDSSFPFFDRYTETEKARVDFDFPIGDSEAVTQDNFYELALSFRDTAIEFVEHVQEQGKAPSSKALRNRIYADGNAAIERLNTVLVDQTISMDEKIFETRSVIEDMFGMFVLLAAFAAEHPEYAPFFSFSRYDFETGATTDDATGQTPTYSVDLEALGNVTFPKPQSPSMSFGTSTPRPKPPMPVLPALPLPGSGTEVVPDESTSEPEEGGEETDEGGEETEEATPKSNSMFAIGALAIATGVLILTLSQKRR